MSTELLFKHRNLPEQVADHIVTLLATDKLHAGQRLFESELCKMLGVSRIPVREALRILQAQGVVHTEPNRGSYIREFSTDESIELLKIRLSIERLALRRVVKLAKSDPSILERIEEAFEEFKRQGKLSDKLASCQADLAFHHEIISLSGSPVLLPLWQSIARGVLVFFMHERQAYYDYQRSIDDHQALMDLIRAGKIAALDAEIERHILHSSPLIDEATLPA
jgi:DNA-binding GntR family transcriptional regulator